MPPPRLFLFRLFFCFVRSAFSSFTQTVLHQVTTISTTETTTPSDLDEGEITRGDGYAKNYAGTTAKHQDTAGATSEMRGR